MKLPIWATTVTPFSKALALALFITLPIAAFFAGMEVQKANYFYEEKTVAPTSVIAPTRTSPLIPSEDNSTTGGNTTIANPASTYCVEQGGQSKIITAADGSQSGQCAFPDGRVCDEWEFFRTKTCK